jgi:GntR family transcriptional regulator/MocR family aminotransferase
VSLHVSLAGRKNLSVEIFRQIRSAIVRGVLRPGDRLPATRELAATLSVARMTVTVAYERLVAEGFASARVGDGTFVSRIVEQRPAETRSRHAEGPLRPRRFWQSVPAPTAFHAPAVYDFRTGLPDGGLFPNAKWRRLLAQTLRDRTSITGVYGDPAGHPQLREAIARHIGVARGVTASADDVIVTNGTQQALDVITRVLMSRFDRVAVEDPGYVPPRQLFESHGLRVAPVPVDGDGLVVRAIPRHVRAAYVTPSHQYPTGAAMTLARRQALLAWADRHDAAIVEDDYDSEFRFSDRPLEPLRTLDAADRVVYIGSFSKTLLPELRLGFLIAPRSLRAPIHRAKFLADWHSPTLLQLALARFIDEGDFARHVRRVTAIYRERHELVSRRLIGDFADHLGLIPSTTGLHVAALARSASVEQIDSVARRALSAGVAIQTLSRFAASDRPRAGVVLGYGAIPLVDIERGLRILHTCFSRIGATTAASS